MSNSIQRTPRAPRVVASLPAATVAAPKPETPKPADVYAELAHAARATGTAKLVVSTRSEGFDEGTLEAMKAAAEQHGGKVLRDNGMFELSRLVEVPAHAAPAAQAALAALVGVEVVPSSALAPPARGKGSADAAEIVEQLRSGTLPEKLVVARALLERLRADGPGAFDVAWRGELARGLYHLSNAVGAMYTALWDSAFTDIATSMQSTLETQGTNIDWNQLRGAARREQELPQHARESEGVRAGMKGIAESLALLDTPASLGVLEQVMTTARNAGTSWVLEHPPVAQKLFSNWLTCAQTRIDQTDFSLPRDTEGMQSPYQSGGYELLSGDRSAFGRHQRSADYIFAKPGAAPLLLLTGPQGAAFARQLVDFVTRNEGKVAPQAAQRETAQVAIARENIESMFEPEQLAQLAPERLQKLVDNAMRGFREDDAMHGNFTLDAMVGNVRLAAYGAYGAADVQSYLEVALPLMSQLLDAAQSPLLLPLLVDEALQLIAMQKANRDSFADPAAADAATERLAAQLGPLVRLAELKSATRQLADLADPVAEKLRTATHATVLMDLLEAELRQPTVPALASVVKREAHEQAGRTVGIAQYGHLEGHDDVVARARALRDATA